MSDYHHGWRDDRKILFVNTETGEVLGPALHYRERTDRIPPHRAMWCVLVEGKWVVENATEGV